jgi:hypothetical protein
MSQGLATTPFKVAQRQTLRLVHLFDALLDASRVTSGKLHASCSAFKSSVVWLAIAFSLSPYTRAVCQSLRAFN